MHIKKDIIVLFAVAILAIVAILMLAGIIFYTVGVGEVAVLVDPVSHTISKPIVGATFGFKAPWQYLIRDFYTIDYIEMSNKPGADYPAINALTNDGVNIIVEMTFTYSVDPNKFNDLVSHYPRIDYEEQRLVPVLRQIVRDVIAKYTIEDVITQRDRIASEIEQQFRSFISEDETLRAIQIHQVNLRGIILPETVQKAIEDKIASYQRKIASQYEAERIVTLARANATAVVLQAEAQKNATILLAQGQKTALMLILNATNDPYVARLWMLKEIEGSNIYIIITGNISYPFIIDTR